MDVLDAIRRPSKVGRVGLGLAAAAAAGSTLVIAPAPASAAPEDCEGQANFTSSYDSGEGIHHSGSYTTTAGCINIYAKASGSCASIRVRFNSGGTSTWKGSCPGGPWVAIATNVQSGTKFRFETDATTVGYAAF